MTQDAQLKAQLATMTPAERAQLMQRYDIADQGPNRFPGQAAFEPGADMAATTLYARMRRLVLKGFVVNLCPFGCKTESLDQHGYCRHLIGFTTDGKHYEPLKRVYSKTKEGLRVLRGRFVQVLRSRIPIGKDEEGEVEFEEGPPELPRVEPTDQVIMITTTGRVYRNADAAKDGEPVRVNNPESKKGK